MFQSKPGVAEPLADYRLDGTTMRYSLFVPRLYNLCRQLGMEQGRIVPSRAFCSDESQGYPVILIAKHFGTFPFNHGQVGGIVATDRHGPHAHHGQDMVIIQASHVGYEAETGTFGIYRRLQTADKVCTPGCGKIAAVVDWYRSQYRFAQNRILIAREDSGPVVIIDNHLLRQNRQEGSSTCPAQGDPVRPGRAAGLRPVPEHRQGLPHGEDLGRAHRRRLPFGARPQPIGKRLTCGSLLLPAADRERRGGDPQPPGAQPGPLHA
jgi:hypothetical protein